MEGKTGYTVAEAAEALGITRDAVRKRISRGTMEAEKGEDGSWIVFLDDGAQGKTDGQDNDDSHYWELINDQRQEIERLRQELQQKDEWISKLIERIPPQLPEPAAEPQDRRPWWQRLFGK